MPRRSIGRLSVSVVGLGANNFGGRVPDAEGTRAVVDAALSSGIDFIDTADVYGGGGGSEELLGQALAGRREEVVLATKFGMDMSGAEGVPDAPHGSRGYVRWAVAGSLRRLGTDVIDLYQMHQPDPATPIAETLRALHELVQEGVVREIGCSNFSARQLADADSAARSEGLTPFASIQNRYSLLRRELEADVMPAAERLGVGIIPYYPLASGLLTGKYRRGEPAPSGARLAHREQVADEDTFARLERLARLAGERGITMLDVAIGWLAARSAVVSVIAGATRPEQVAANAAAARWTPTADDLAAIDDIFPPPGEAALSS